VFVIPAQAKPECGIRRALFSAAGFGIAPAWRTRISALASLNRYAERAAKMDITRITDRFVRLLAIACLVAGANLMAAPQVNADAAPSLDQMLQVVAKASERASRWDGPVSGPAGRPDMKIAVICEDLRNGGVLGVARGVIEAAKIMDWKVSMFDTQGTPEGRNEKLEAALATQPDGAILIGSDARSLESRLARFAKQGIPLVGWHVGPIAGKLSSGSVAMNVSTNPLEVGRVTAMAAIVESLGHAGVVIFTDSNFEIAMIKAHEMAKVIRECQGCTLLEVRRLPISQSAQLMPIATRELLDRFGERWTHALAINDIYFDYAAPELTKAGRDIHLFSAGDGSPAAFLRIQAGTFQYGTVAEPLNLQGWQLVDELNRLLSGQPVTGYVMPVHLVTAENIAFDGGPEMMFDPDNGYRQAYRHIWKH
jgi:ribose transport system substrate-binding protein